MPKLLIGGLIAAAFAASIPAVAQVPVGAATPQPPAAKAVKSRADVQAAIARRFARMDTNRDGFVSQDEVQALQAKRAERGQKRAEKRANRFDPARMFARLDANQDGNITRAEAEAARAARVAARGKPANAQAVAFGGLFERADTNRDGVLSRAEFNAAPPKARMGGKRGGPRHAGMKHGMGGRLFALGDANKDGRVSLAEAQQAALSRFDRADINRDGQITPEERRQARQQRRGQRQPA
jgi:Ca2+-binding EF-hand superfamily protein